MNIVYGKRKELDMDINKWYQCYCQKTISKSRLKEILMMWAYKQVETFSLINEDEKQELILLFYCRADGYLDNYKSEKKNFLNYMLMNLHYSFLYLRSCNAKKNIQTAIAYSGDYHIEQLSCKVAIADNCFEKSNYSRCEDEHYNNSIENYYGKHYPKLDEQLLTNESINLLKYETKKSTLSPKKKKHLLVHFLKQINELSTSQIDAYCEIFDFNKDEIYHYIFKLQQLISTKKERKNRYFEIMNKHFTGLQLLRYRHYNCEDNLLKKILTEKIMNAESRLKNSIKRYQNCLVDPTNNELATVLGIPKGTIDSIFVTHPYNSLPLLKDFV